LGKGVPRKILIEQPRPSRYVCKAVFIMSQSNIPTALSLDEFTPTSYEAWKAEAEASLKGAPFDKKLLTRTPEGITLQPIYTAADAVAEAGYPGVFPFTRGARPVGYRAGGWDVAQNVPQGTPKEFNQAIRSDLERGQTSVTLSLDRASRLGLDPDAAAPGDVACCGLSLSSLEDMAKALDGVDLAKIPVHLNPGPAPLSLFAVWAAYTKKKGVSLSAIEGSYNADPIGDWLVEGTLPLTLDAALDQMAAVTRWGSDNMPKFQTIGVRANTVLDAGGSSVQELAYAMAAGVAYLRAMTQRGLTVEQVVPRMRFTVGIGSNFFMELAKLRAVRQLWARVVEAFGGKTDAAMVLHAKTATWNKSAIDPYTNMLRTTSEAFSAVLGGCDSLHVSPFDEVIRSSDEFSRRIARNTQIILREECHLDKVVDPAGGSWFVEWLTEQLASKAWAQFQAIEKAGGLVPVLISGSFQKEVEATAKEKWGALAARRNVVVGVNAYPNLNEKPLAGCCCADSAALQAKRSRDVAGQRTSGEQEAAIAVLAKLSDLLGADPARCIENASEAATLGATLGELVRALAADPKPSAPIPTLRARRLTEFFEALRARTDAAAQGKDGRPKVFLANMGPLKQHKPRADFSQEFFRVGGFDVVNPKGHATPDEAASAAAASGARIVVLCSTDDTYPDIVPTFAAKLKESVAGVVLVLAGYPEAHVEAFKQAGVDEFIHVRSNCLETLSAMQQRLGIA
jgi:methylmalonyl-CoA mutase